LEVGGITSTVSEDAASDFAVVVRGSAGGLLVGGREDSSSPELAVEEPSGTKGNDGRNSEGMGRGAMPGKFRGGKEGRGGKPRTKMTQITYLPSTKRALSCQIIICICTLLGTLKLREEHRSQLLLTSRWRPHRPRAKVPGLLGTMCLSLALGKLAEDSSQSAGEGVYPGQEDSDPPGKW
jgi:hypothetical protein